MRITAVGEPECWTAEEAAKAGRGGRAGRERVRREPGTIKKQIVKCGSILDTCLVLTVR